MSMAGGALDAGYQPILGSIQDDDGNDAAAGLPLAPRGRGAGPAASKRRLRSLDAMRGLTLRAGAQARNKQSISLDLRSASGRELVKELVPSCDAVVENFRPGRMEEMGLGPEELAALNPGLVCVVLRAVRGRWY